MLNKIAPSGVNTPCHLKMPETSILNADELIKEIRRIMTLIEMLEVRSNNEEQRVLTQRRNQR